jgi:beta-lactamase superfamily II metal-dependent hydrolase
MKLTLLPSEKGDCMLLESPDGTAILVDGGMYESYTDYVRPFLAAWREKNNRPLDLVYLSHIDQDHIAGVLNMMNDMVDWRVYRHKKDQGEDWDKPDFPEPPEVKRLWHNGFHHMVGENAGEIGSMLAARVALLATSGNTALQNLGAAYQAIAASIPESIKLSRRVSAKQLKIPLNKEFDGFLAMVRNPPDEIRLNGAASPLIRVVGPFEENLKELRRVWNAWLRDKKNEKNLKRTRRWLRDEDERFDFSDVAALDIDDELGDRGEVTEQNLASLMLLVEQNGQSIILTGDGHIDEIIEGLEFNKALKKGEGLHVNVLKIPHHGSENNFKREFARRITADHYVFCGNGQHENPDLRVLQVLAESRLGSGDEFSGNPEAGNPFHVWFNCSVPFLEADISKRKKEKRDYDHLEKALKHFRKIERDMEGYVSDSGGKLKLHYLKDKPLVLDLG